MHLIFTLGTIKSDCLSFKGEKENLQVVLDYRKNNVFTFMGGVQKQVD